MSEEIDISSSLLAAAEDMKMSVTLDGIDSDDMQKYLVKQLRENYHKPKRTSGRKADEKYTVPVGIFNLGNNTVYFKEDVEVEEEDEDDDLAEVIHMDGKVIIPEKKEETREEKDYMFNVAAKNDLPYLIYNTILNSGRLTVEELWAKYGAIEKELFLLVVNNMISKKYLKKIKEKDQNIVFNSDETVNFNESYSIVEKEVEVLEIIGNEERRRVLGEK